MEKIGKLLLAYFTCFILCLSVLNWNAATVYDVSCTSTKHTYSGVTHYFAVNGNAKVVGSDRIVENITTQWKSSGSGTYSINGSAITNYDNGNYKKYYSGVSTIKIGTSASASTHTQKCNATLTY